MQTLKSVRQVSVGIIGTGWGVNVQVPAFRAAGWHVGALCARTAEKAQQLGQQLGIPFVTSDPLELINHPSVCVPNSPPPTKMQRNWFLRGGYLGQGWSCDGCASTTHARISVSGGAASRETCALWQTYVSRCWRGLTHAQRGKSTCLHEILPLSFVPQPHWHLQSISL